MRAAFLLALWTGAAAAQNVPLGPLVPDPGAAVEVEADSLEMDQATGAATFRGNVRIAQGELTLTAGEVVVVYAEGSREIARLDATGGVTMTTPTDEASAATARYDLANGVLVLDGDVQLVQGATTLSAATVTVDLDSGTATAEGRVRTTLGAP